MNIKIASWNVERKLSNINSKKRGNSNQIINMIKSINADIFFLPEAYLEKSLEPPVETVSKLKALGYALYHTPYDDNLGLRQRTDSQDLSLAILSKIPIEHFKTIRLGNYRNAINVTIKNNSEHLNIFGIHLDDLNESTRLAQVRDLINEINTSNIPTIVLGDFNAMHGHDFWPSKLLRTKFVKLISTFIWPDVFKRVIGMATGDTIKLLETKTNIIDVDSKHRPTTTPKLTGYEWLPSIKLIQIDHIFVSPTIKTSNFKVYADGGADHRAISVDIVI